MAADGGVNKYAGARAPSTAAARLWSAAVLLSLAPQAAMAGPATGAAPLDLTTLPFEQLLSLDVYSASKFVQRADQAPASVTVIEASDIKAYGWRTLADALRSVRGLHLSYDRNYTYLGARGFLRPGDYNSRFLLQIDGQRVNDALYDQAPVGGEFPLDLDLVERIEYVPGPGSSIYGANAFFGVINVITKRPQENAGGRATLETGQFGERKGSANYAWSDRRGNEVLLAASRYKSDGRDLYFPEFDQPDNNNGVARGLDYESGQRFFAKGASGPFSLSLLHAERIKGMPTASFEQSFNDPRSHTVDTQSYANLGYRVAPSPDTELSAHLFWGAYDSVGDYAYDAPEGMNRDGSASRWWGMDLTTVSAPAAGHKLVAGAEYQDDYRLRQFSFDLAPRLDYLNDARQGKRYGLYLQDEWRLRADLLLNAGLRYDYHALAGGVFSPRLALIHQAGPDTTLKAMYGTAYREPNNFELYYAFPGPGGQIANPALNRERIRSLELALVRQLAGNARLTVSVFRNDVKALISQETEAASGLAVFENAAPARARGVELEYERKWTLASLRASYSRQQLSQSDSDAGAVNSPARLGKVNLAAPLWHSMWRAGLEAQYVGPRATLLARSGGFWLANLNLYSRRLTRHADLAVGFYNLCDRRYADPAPPAQRQDSLAQDGRSARVTLTYAF
ncbi:MAG TPA: TonB-dependent receptor [Janthinobacterium sp.]|nr:TonB-dependent receptor [Janthinobacterium sp.]